MGNRRSLMHLDVRPPGGPPPGNRRRDPCDVLLQRVEIDDENGCVQLVDTTPHEGSLHRLSSFARLWATPGSSCHSEELARGTGPQRRIRSTASEITHLSALSLYRVRAGVSCRPA